MLRDNYGRSDGTTRKIKKKGSTLTPLTQPNKNAPPHHSSGPWPSSWKLLNSVKVDQSMRSKRQANTLLSSLPSLGCSGTSARLKRQDSGLGMPLLPIRIGVILGVGG